MLKKREIEKCFQKYAEDHNLKIYIFRRSTQKLKNIFFLLWLTSITLLLK